MLTVKELQSFRKSVLSSVSESKIPELLYHENERNAGNYIPVERGQLHDGCKCSNFLFYSSEKTLNTFHLSASINWKYRLCKEGCWLVRSYTYVF
jgi:hypothetical protein